MKRAPRPLSGAEIEALFGAPPEQWPKAEKTLLEQGERAALIAFELSDNAFAESFLPKAAKRAAVRDALERVLENSRAPLTLRLMADSPKRRKQAARLVGAMANPVDAPALIRALEGEATRFVRPSLLLALGNMPSGAAAEFLSAYEVEPAEKAEDEKHASEERRALDAALSRLRPPGIPGFVGLDETQRVELRGAMPEMILFEGEKLAIQMLRRADGVELFCADMQELAGLRSWREALLPLGKCAFGVKPVVDLIEGFKLLDKLRRWHAPCEAFPARLEMRGVTHDERTAFIRECVLALTALGFSNAPGAYAVEIRIERAKDGVCGVYAVLTQAEDTRFEYRKRALPASIHPADAAALVRFAFGNAPPGRVIDPCCGSGTLLIECAKHSPARLLGGDISHSAIDAARENAAAAGVKMQLVRKDLKELIAGEPFDALLANLPFGLRTGTHDANKALYPALLDNLARWLRPGGVAALYTADAKLLLRELKRRRNLTLEREARMEAGGLYSHIVVVRMNRA